jgi:hypothetical protein
MARGAPGGTAFIVSISLHFTNSDTCSQTYVFVRSRQPAISLGQRPLCILDVKRRLILDEQTRAAHDARLVVLLVDVVAVHVAAVLAHRVEFHVVEHLTELLELVLSLLLVYVALLLVEHALECVEIGAVLDEA